MKFSDKGFDIYYIRGRFYEEISEKLYHSNAHLIEEIRCIITTTLFN